ncbi:MAG: Bug family tripartite tricarboxylate transporter substrate binding protein [bacterium]|jgi:tripartite-type tricarboxylate transporter receptor subunit TctC|nr:tripartite tricarboxylate transporter substrate binding protein [Betaproteobacteria bacterium]
MRRRSIALAAMAGVLAATAAPAFPQAAGSSARDFPTRPLRLVLGYAPGGTTDILSRLLAVHLSQSLGQPVIVDNRPGASAMIGSHVVATAVPDGHTLLMTPSGTHTSNLSLYRKVPYDTVKDFAPITLFAWVSNMIVTHPSTPLNSLQDVIRQAKASPGKLTYASVGIGSVSHLSAEMLKNLAGIDVTHVPYKGGGPALAAIAANEVTIMFAALPSASSFVQAKRIKPLVVTSPKRSPTLPDVPTVAEAGIAGLQVMEWYGALAPAGTPRGVVQRLRDELVAIIKRPEITARFIELGADPDFMTPEAFSKQIDADIRMWAAVVKQSGIRAD